MNLSQDIAQALAFLHANGIIHRDLSSNNVLLIAGSRAKVSDFGMSKFSTSHLATMTTCPGTPVFMSPEALDEPPVYTEKLDAFSFGVLLVQINTRQFPDPTDRFKKIDSEAFSSQHLSHNTKLFAKIPEVERRQAHIGLIEPTHPLLPLALECLKDEAVERPSSQQLCQSLDALKGTVEYQDSWHMHQFLQKQVQEKGLDFNEETTSTLQHTITQRDKEIAELRQLLLNKKHEESKQLKCSHIVQATPDSVQQINMTWEIIPDAPESFDKVSAVVGEKAYFKWARFIYELNLTTYRWDKLNDHQLLNFSLVSIENDLTTVGGFKENWRGTNADSNKLYSYIQGKWVEKYPPMPTKHHSCAAVYANHALIVAGGASIAGTSLPTVEILNSCNNHWSTVSSLPTPTLQPSVSICGECIYLHNTHIDQGSEYSVVRCSLFRLAFSSAKQVIWEEVASLPVEGSTLVTVESHLLAVGGESTKGRSKDIYQYNPNTDSWHVIAQMNVARSHCAAALLQDNKLIVIGGSYKGHPNELATIL